MWVCAETHKKKKRDYRFRSCDLWVMGPARFLCAKSRHFKARILLHVEFIFHSHSHTDNRVVLHPECESRHPLLVDAEPFNSLSHRGGPLVHRPECCISWIDSFEYALFEDECGGVHRRYGRCLFIIVAET